jgi:hypothetical protein
MRVSQLPRYGRLQYNQENVTAMSASMHYVQDGTVRDYGDNDQYEGNFDDEERVGVIW